MKRVLGLVWVTVLIARTGVAGEPVSDVRPVMERGLAYLAKEALVWKEKKKCASCHQGPMGIWSLNEARAAGYGIDEKAVVELTEWVSAKGDPARIFLAGKPAAEVFMNQVPLMLALGIEAGPEDLAARSELKEMLARVAADQRADGSWRTMFDWEPLGAQAETLTTLALMSLTGENAPDTGAAGRKAIAKGVAWLKSGQPPKTLQGAMTRLILWRRLGLPPAEWESLAQQLLQQQNPDGGWSQEKVMESDAYMTGQALYALAESGIEGEERTIAEGQAFLMQTQRPDGSWRMESRAGGPKNEPAGNLAPISYTGTAWAVMGLARTAPVRK